MTVFLAGFFVHCGKKSLLFQHVITTWFAFSIFSVPLLSNCNTTKEKNAHECFVFSKAFNCFALWLCAIRPEKWRIGYFSPSTEALNVNGVFLNPVRLKKRRQLKQSQTEKSASEQNSTIISCPGHPNDAEPNKKTDPQRITYKPPAGSGGNCTTNSWRFETTLKTLNTVHIAKNLKENNQVMNEINVSKLNFDFFFSHARLRSLFEHPFWHSHGPVAA